MSENTEDTALELVNTTSAITMEQFRALFPQRAKSLATQENLDAINELLENEDARELYRERFLFNSILLDSSKFTVKQYMNAVKFATLKLMGDTSVSAYAKTFPERYERLIAEDKDVTSFASNYARGQLVTQIIERSLVPIHVLNQDIIQKTINRLYYIGHNAKSEMAQVKALDSLLTNLKQPEAQKIDLNINHNEDYMANFFRNLEKRAEMIKQAIDIKAYTVKEIAEIPLFEKRDENES